MKTDKLRLTIGEFSRFCQVTVKTLKHYEKMGLLLPNEVDEWTKYRYYDVAQMQQLNSILRLKDMGFSLEEVRDLFDEGTHRPSIKQVESKMVAVRQQMEQLQERLAVLHRLGESIQQIERMNGIVIERLPEIIVAVHRRILRRREDLTHIFNHTISPAIQQIGCRRSQPIYGFSIEHEQEYKDEYIDTEYCLQVEEMYHDTDIIKFKHLPEVPMAVCMKFVGPYDRYHEHFLEIFRYVAEHDYKVSGPYRTQYVEGPWNQKDPEKYVTVIQVPVTKQVETAQTLSNDVYY